MSKKRGLGKGLSALIPVEESNDSDKDNEMKQISLNKISPNPNQPRQKIDEQSLSELINSIETHGLIQPIIVRPKDNDDNYEIIAGERRWEACKKLNFQQIPAIIKNYNDMESSAAALIENVQREDLNAVDEAIAYKKLMQKYGLTQDELSLRVGKSRSFIANMVRILGLPIELIEMLRKEVITVGHARALLSLPDAGTQIKFAIKITRKKLSVRKTEELVKKYLEDYIKQNNSKEKRPEKIFEWENWLTGTLGSEVKIKNNQNGSGQLIIKFNNQDEFVKLVNNIRIIN